MAKETDKRDEGLTLVMKMAPRKVISLGTGKL